MGRVAVHWSWTVWLAGQGLGKNTSGKFVPTRSGEKACWYTYQNGHLVCRYSWILNKGWCQWCWILITTWIGWPVLWILVSLLPQSLLSFPNMFINQVATMAEMEGICRPIYMYCRLPRTDWLQPLLSAQLASSKNQHAHGTIPQGDQPATWRQVDYIGLFPLWRGSSLFTVKKSLFLYMVLAQLSW